MKVVFASVRRRREEEEEFEGVLIMHPMLVLGISAGVGEAKVTEERVARVDSRKLRIRIVTVWRSLVESVEVEGVGE